METVSIKHLSRMNSDKLIAQMNFSYNSMYVNGQRFKIGFENLIKVIGKYRTVLH